MKNLLVSVLIIFVFITSASAQHEGDFRASGSLLLNFDNAKFGVNFGGEYFFTDQVSVAPSYSNLFGTPSLSGINVDGRYYFTESTDNWYGLAGFASVTGGRVTSSGINLGAGYVVPIQGDLSLGLQLKYSTVRDGTLEMQGGVVYKFK
ncbi:MAG: hypothetical protein NWS46_09405 [Cyclobacteriaceae bacterium]|nr:hypothetical protein [Cyclobacteriaceae bacterium]